MGRTIEMISRDAVDSLIGWWRESGVDTAVGEQPRAWLRSDAPIAQVETQVPLPATDVTEKPATLAAFHAWISQASGLPLDRPGAVRVLPNGLEQSPLMVLSDLPGREEAEAGLSFAGDAQILLDKMIRAIGIDPDATYRASLAFFHNPGARITGTDLDRCGAIARDHIRLARPQRLILFGDASARALIGEPLARARGKVHHIEGVRTIVTFHPRWLLQRPSDKALAWRDLILLMSESK